MKTHYQVRVPDMTEKVANLVETPRGINTPYMTLTSQTVEDASNKTVGVDITIRVTPFDLPAEELTQYQAALNDTQNHGYWAAVIRSNKNSTDNVLVKNDEVNLEHIKRLIDEGSYDSALEAISTFLDSQESPEGYYLKGLVLGFMNDYEESEVAFGKAEAMGYELWRPSLSKRKP